jgi:Arc/MetJ-type ribon-helix-helix transcriptional regulator
MSTNKKSVKISEHLYKLLEQKIHANKFNTVDDYIEHILLQLFQAEGADEIDPDEEKEIKKRLEQLGYL